MSDFVLDTSGVVPACNPLPDGKTLGPLGFHDLSPFEQGYVEAVFAANRGALTVINMASCVHRDARFSDLAPETLAAIRKDCAAAGQGARMAKGHEGAIFWHERQDGRWLPVGIPPVSPDLNDAGKVVFS